jgi:hypothetical protein
MIDADHKREGGAALLVAVLMLALMGIVGLASMDTVSRDRQVAGFQKRAVTSLYASEAGVARALGLIRADAQGLADGGEGALLDYDPSGESPPRFPIASGPEALGGSTFPAPGSPTFFMDPNATDPNNTSAPSRAIRYIGKGDLCPGWVVSMETGAIDWSEALWDIRVRGTNPGGTFVDVQATGTNCHPYN